MLWDVFHYWKLYVPYFETPRFHPLYLESIRPWAPGGGCKVHLIVMGIAALGLALGLFYRFSSAVFFTSYAYFFLMDKFLYNNHYYLYGLLAFLLIFVDAHRVWSLDSLRKPALSAVAPPGWNYFVLRAQIIIVYFFGGIAKLNADWLSGEPMRHWLARKTDFWLIGPWLGHESAAWFFSYGGLFFDLSIGFLLLWKKTRWPAVAVSLFFHLMNQWMFDIGIFPYVMIAATVLFFGTDEPAPIKGRLEMARPVRVLIGLYMAVQILAPLRHWIYPGDPAWTEEGHLFSWRMMLRDKKSRIRMRIEIPGTGEVREVDLNADMAPSQAGMLSGRPDLIWQYAQFLKRRLETSGERGDVIRAQVQASLNFRQPQDLIDASVNLAEIDYPLFGHAPWIVPLVSK